MENSYLFYISDCYVTFILTTSIAWSFEQVFILTGVSIFIQARCSDLEKIMESARTKVCSGHFAPATTPTSPHSQKNRECIFMNCVHHVLNFHNNAHFYGGLYLWVPWIIHNAASSRFGSCLSWVVSGRISYFLFSSNWVFLPCYD